MKLEIIGTTPRRQRRRTMMFAVSVCSIGVVMALMGCDLNRRDGQPAAATTTTRADPCATLRKNAEGRPPAIGAAQTPSTGTAESAPSGSETQRRDVDVRKIYARFTEKRNMCPSIIDTIAQDKTLEGCLMQIFSRGEESSDALALIRLSPVAAGEPIRFLLAREGEMRLGTDCHGGPMQIYSDKTQNCMYCRLTDKELHEVETLGPSEVAWTLRKEWLDEYFKYLNLPWYDLAPPIRLDAFVEFFDQTKKIYSSDESKIWVREWLQTAEGRINKAAAAAEKNGYLGSTDEQKKQNHAMINEFLASLRRDP